MTTLTLAKLAEIEVAAAKATPGPWKRSTGTCNYRIYGNYEHVADCQQVGRGNRGRLEVADTAMSGAANANYIALCDPATVAALCQIARTAELSRRSGFRDNMALFNAIRDSGLLE